MRLTKTQIEALERLRDGRVHSFGYGCGKYRVALRALHMRFPQMLTYCAANNSNDETFAITPLGISALNYATV